jgi:hypothetical protein
LYGKDYDEQRAIALETTRAAVTQIYEASKHYVNNAESAILHGRPLEQILTRTKVHLDAYLATAEVILEQNVDPGYLEYPSYLRSSGVGCKEVDGSTIVKQNQYL